jgi:hypothetical protein
MMSNCNLDIIKVMASSHIELVKAANPTRSRCESSSIEQANLAKESDKMEDWDVRQTAGFLKRKGFDSYADHFESEGYNGMVLCSVEQDDVDEMPEANKLKRRAFCKLLESVKAGK